MKAHDIGSSLFWLCFSMLVCASSFWLGIGSLHKPSAGLWSFGASALLGILSLGLFVKALIEPRTTRTESAHVVNLSGKVILVLVSMALYAKFMQTIGYLLTSFLLMGVLFWLAGVRKWWSVLLYAFLSAFVTYQVFSVWLNCQFPRGLFGF
jgi:hypothetical protein